MHQDRIESRPVSPALGAEVSGCDLSRPLDDDAFEAILAALLRYQVLVFRDRRSARPNRLRSAAASAKSKSMC